MVLPRRLARAHTSCAFSNERIMESMRFRKATSRPIAVTSRLRGPARVGDCSVGALTRMPNLKRSSRCGASRLAARGSCRSRSSAAPLRTRRYAAPCRPPCARAPKVMSSPRRCPDASGLRGDHGLDSLAAIGVARVDHARLLRVAMCVEQGHSMPSAPAHPTVASPPPHAHRGALTATPHEFRAFARDQSFHFASFHPQHRHATATC